MNRQSIEVILFINLIDAKKLFFTAKELFFIITNMKMKLAF